MRARVKDIVPVIGPVKDKVRVRAGGVAPGVWAARARAKVWVRVSVRVREPSLTLARGRSRP